MEEKKTLSEEDSKMVTGGFSKTLDEEKEYEYVCCPNGHGCTIDVAQRIGFKCVLCGETLSHVR